MREEKQILFVAWQEPEGRGIYPVGRLTVLEKSPRFEFVYIQGAMDAQRDHGFEPFLAFPDLTKVYRSDELFPFFQNRLMPESRPDFFEHLQRLGLERGAPAVTVLSRSGGDGTSEKLSLFGMPIHDPSSGVFTYFFLARGVRHVEGAEERIRALKPGDEFDLEEEPENPADPLAVVLLDGSRHSVGYMPRYLVEDVRTFMQSARELKVTVERMNPPPAPVHHRLLCKMRVRPADSHPFSPFATARYQPAPQVGGLLAVVCPQLPAP
jgi:hypothetical protein